MAVVLSGCGVYDGSEVHESSAVLTHLSRHGAEVSVFAPDKVGGLFNGRGLKGSWGNCGGGDRIRCKMGVTERWEETVRWGRL